MEDASRSLFCTFSFVALDPFICTTWLQYFSVALASYRKCAILSPSKAHNKGSQTHATGRLLLDSSLPFSLPLFRCHPRSHARDDHKVKGYT